MHLQFESITLKRFRSFHDEATLFFDDAGAGLYFLKGANKSSKALGSNGAGKSSIVDALMWCLYGKTVQGLKNPDIIPWSGKGKTEVTVAITIDKKQHIIRRTVGPNLLTIDEKEAGQEYVNKLIAIPFEIIPYTIILGQRQPLFYDLTASEKLRLFSEVLDLDRWEKRSAHAAELTNNLAIEIGIKEAELEAFSNAYKQACSDFDALKLQSAAWEKQRALQLANAEKDKAALQKQLEAVANEQGTADLKLDRALTELKASPIETLRRQYNVSLNEIVKYEEMLRTQIRYKARYDAELISIQDCICPTCKQETDKELTKKLRIDLTKNIKVCNDQIAFLEKEIGLSKEIRDQTLEKYDIEEKAAKVFENDASAARDIINRLLPKIAGWKAEIKAIEGVIQRNEGDDNPHTEQLQTLRRRRDLNKAAIKHSEETIKTKTEYAERAKFWIKGFKDIKLLTIEEILQELDITTGGMLEEFGLVGWQIKYDIERETKSGTIARGLNITVLSPNNKNPVKWEVWSGGEAQRLRTVGALALGNVLLNHIGHTTNLIMLDEPTESLSKEGVSDLIELLASYTKNAKKAAWIVDHHVIESSKFIKTITVIKDQKGSSINETN